MMPESLMAASDTDFSTAPMEMTTLDAPMATNGAGCFAVILFDDFGWLLSAVPWRESMTPESLSAVSHVE